MEEGNRGLMLEIQTLNQETNDRIKRIIERHMGVRGFRMSCGFITMAVAEIVSNFLHQEREKTGLDFLSIQQFERLIDAIGPSNEEIYSLIEKHVKRIVDHRTEYTTSHKEEFEFTINFDPEAVAEFEKGPVGVFEVSHFLRLDTASSLSSSSSSSSSLSGGEERREEGEERRGRRNHVHFVRRAYLKEETCELFAMSDSYEAERLCLDEESPFRGRGREEESGFIEVPNLNSLLSPETTEMLLQSPSSPFALKSGQLEFRATESLGQPPHTLVPLEQPIRDVSTLFSTLSSGSRIPSSCGRWLSLPIERNDGSIQRLPSLFFSLSEWRKTFFSGPFRLDQEGNSSVIDCAGHFQVLLRTMVHLSAAESKRYTLSNRRVKMTDVLQEKGLNTGQIVECTILINSLPCQRSNFSTDPDRFTFFHSTFHPSSVRPVVIPFPFFCY